MVSINLPATSTVSGDSPALVFAVQHFCLHDGPGTRSMVFFKGCPLRCAWCQNPESWSKNAELAYKPHLCISCETCVAICPTGAMTAPGTWDPARCDGCGRCVDACPAEAMVQFGEAKSVDAVFDALCPEFGLFRRSGGGVTLSGGEATLFVSYARDLAERLKKQEIHVAIETCGLFQLEALEPLLAHVDLLLYDLKLVDDALHRRYCGASNARIKANLTVLVERAWRGAGPRIWPRLPLIPGLTSTAENVRGWATLLQRLGVTGVTLVPYHELGAGKRAWLPNAPPAPTLGTLTDEVVDRCRTILAEAAIETYLPGEERWNRHVSDRARAQPDLAP